MNGPARPAGAHAEWREGGSARAVFAIEGMRCAACARAIERAVSAVAGVERIAVNAATARATASWVPGEVTLAEILAVVDGAGFRALPLAGEAAEDARRTERRTMLKRIGVAGLGMMQTMMFVYGLYAVTERGIDPRIEQYLRVVSMLVSTPVLFYSGAPFLRGALRDLRARTLGMDVPVAAALLLAFGASVLNTLRGSGEVYFDSVTMFVFLLLAGRFVELTVRQGSLGAGEALTRSLPTTALRCLATGGTERVPVSAIRPGDRLQIPRGGIVPVDARLASHAASIDEALVTGESAPVLRREGELVLGGSVNAGNAIRLVAQTGIGTSALASIVALLERSQAERPRLARTADRVASWFVLAVLLLAAAVAIGWWLVEPASAFPAALAVLVVTCPCALSLAAPVAIAAATTRLARLGVLVTRADAVERLAGITTVVLDKTGTLTEGAPELHETETRGAMEPARARAIAAALERASLHPIARAFAPYDDTAIPIEQPAEIAGRGIEGWIDGVPWRIGRAEFVAALGEGDVPDTGDRVVLGSHAGIAATFSLREAVRPDARAALERLRSRGLEIVLASGDREESVREVAAALGIGEAIGRCDPARKVALVRERQARGERVLMVGDGINDGPVLAAADVSCAMGQGTAVAQAAADLLLLGESLTGLARAVDVARSALGVVRQNLRWSLVYNLGAVPLAALHLIAPWVAAVGMSASSLLVVLNAARLAREDRDERRGPEAAAPGEAAGVTA